MNKHLIWAISLILIVLMICSTIIYINYNSWTLRFEMDDNTKEAIESIEFPIQDGFGCSVSWNQSELSDEYEIIINNALSTLDALEEVQ